MTVITSLIVAVAKNGVIGRNGGLPWHMSSDLKKFRRLTMGKPIIMGRKTFQSIGKPLDGRHNIVLSSDPSFKAEGVNVFSNLEDALILARTIARTSGLDEVMVIGGVDVFKATLPVAQRIYWTEIKGNPDGNVYFETLDTKNWHAVSEEVLPKGLKDDYEAVLKIYERRPHS
ncbi:MAG: dihydrofolate reductase [Hyphomicrobium sp.]